MIIFDPTTSSFHFQIYPKGIQYKISDGMQNSDETEQLIFNNLQKIILGENIQIDEKEIQQFNEIDTSNPAALKNFTTTTIYSILQIVEILDNDEIRQKLYKRLFEFIGRNNNNNQTNNDTISKETVEKKLNKLIQIEKVLKLFQIFQYSSDFIIHDREEVIKNVQNYLHQDYDQFIKEIAQLFSMIDDQIIFKLNDVIIQDVLSSSFLHVKNEDCLLKTLIKRRSFLSESKYKDEYDLNFVFQYILFEYLSVEGIQAFLNEIQFDDIDQSIWNKIVKRIILPVNPDSEKTGRYSDCNLSFGGNEFSYNSEKPLDGIFKHLTDTSKGNIQTNKTIELSCSRLCCYLLETIVDSNNSQCYTHIDRDQNVAWLKIDFKKYKVLLKSYIIKVFDNSCKRYMRSWKVDISNDGEKWETIDEQNDVSELNGDNKMKLFNVNKTHNPFRFMRIFVDKNNWSNDSSYSSDGFTIRNLELFGKIIE